MSQTCFHGFVADWQDVETGEEGYHCLICGDEWTKEED